MLGALLNLAVPEAHLREELDLEVGVGLLQLFGLAQVRIYALAALLELRRSFGMDNKTINDSEVRLSQFICLS